MNVLKSSRVAVFHKTPFPPAESQKVHFAVCKNCHSITAIYFTLIDVTVLHTIVFKTLTNGKSKHTNTIKNFIRILDEPHSQPLFLHFDWKTTTLC